MERIAGSNPAGPIIFKMKLNEILKELEKGDKLLRIENMIQEGKINERLAEGLLLQSPLSEKEVIEIVNDIKKEFYQRHGLEFPDYKIEYVDSKNLDTIAGTTDIFTKTITLPNNQGLIIPVTLAHELAHSYQMENSVLYQKFKELNEDKNYKEMIYVGNRTSCLTEGWATFVSKIYAEIRDERIGKNVYLNLLKEKNNFVTFVYLLSNDPKYYGYDEGCRLFEKIYEKNGFNITCKLAQALISDDVLKAYV